MKKSIKIPERQTIRLYFSIQPNTLGTEECNPTGQKNILAPCFKFLMQGGEYLLHS